ncbi:MAG: hypothetical protein AB7N76_07200 [Planctomycetota bacterium]
MSGDPASVREIAHELNNLLSGIACLASLIASPEASRASTERDYEELRERITRAGLLTSRLLALDETPPGGWPTLSPEPAAAPDPGSRRAVLVVEPEVPLRALIRRLLLRAGFDVAEAPDGATARALATGRPFDLALVSGVLPEGPGRLLARALRELQPRLAALFVEADPAPPEGDAERTLRRPFVPHALLSAVRGALADAEARAADEGSTAG